MNILGIDWGEKYIGLSKKCIDTCFIVPIGYIQNDGDAMFNLSEIIIKHKVKKIVIGWPRREKYVQLKIDSFIKEFGCINANMEFIKINEDYTSVEASALMGNFKKESGKKDTVASMKILERYKN